MEKDKENDTYDGKDNEKDNAHDTGGGNDNDKEHDKAKAHSIENDKAVGRRVIRRRGRAGRDMIMIWGWE